MLCLRTQQYALLCCKYASMQFLFYFVSSDVNREFVERIKKIYGVKETLTEAIVPVGHRKNCGHQLYKACLQNQALRLASIVSTSPFFLFLSLIFWMSLGVCLCALCQCVTGAFLFGSARLSSEVSVPRLFSPTHDPRDSNCHCATP